jgi:putative hydrolase
MKSWRQYENHLLQGEWHIHTSYTDGEGSIFAYCRRAVDLGIPLLAFTEHVRRSPNYDFHAFLSDIDAAQEDFDLIILSGCEAKILLGGDLDAADAVLSEVDYPVFSFHSFPLDIELRFSSLEAALKNRYVNAWAHPVTSSLGPGMDFPEERLKEIFDLMRTRDVLFELNEKYGDPAEAWMSLAKEMGVSFVRGSDVHFMQDLRSFSSMEGG